MLGQQRDPWRRYCEPMGRLVSRVLTICQKYRLSHIPSVEVLLVFDDMSSPKNSALRRQRPIRGRRMTKEKRDCRCQGLISIRYATFFSGARQIAETVVTVCRISTWLAPRILVPANNILWDDRYMSHGNQAMCILYTFLRLSDTERRKKVWGTPAECYAAHLAKVYSG